MQYSNNLAGLIKAAADDNNGHASSALTLLPFGTLIKSVADDDSFARFLGRQTMDSTGGAVGGVTGAGALGGLSHLLSKGKSKATAPLAVLGALLGSSAGTYGADKAFDHFTGPKVKSASAVPHTTSALALVPGGTIMKSVRDDESAPEWAGRAVLDVGGGALGGGLGALAGAGLGAGVGHVAGLDPDKSLTVGLLLGKLLGAGAGVYGTDKLYDSLMDTRAKNHRRKKPEDK